MSQTDPPSAGDPATERFAAILLQLEQHPSQPLVLTSLGVRQGAATEAKVIATLPDRSREVLTPANARFLARCLRADPGYLEAWDQADALDQAADDAEASAAAQGFQHGGGRPFFVPRALAVR